VLVHATMLDELSEAGAADRPALLAAAGLDLLSLDMRIRASARHLGFRVHPE
jgi:hypothetical protein